MFLVFLVVSNHIFLLQKEKTPCSSGFMPIYTQKRAKTGLEPFLGWSDGYNDVTELMSGEASCFSSSF